MTKEIENNLDTKKTLAAYIANNLYRMGNSKSGYEDTAILLMMAAASIMNIGDDPQTLAAARRVAQMALTKQKRK